LNNTQINQNNNEISKNKYDNNYCNLNNGEKNINKENLNEKKRISLNVNSPKFTRKTIENDIPTFNPLSNMTVPFNKFDEFDPSSN